MRHLADSPDGLSLTAVADAAGLPPSTTHRLLTTLEAERFVRPDPQAGVWRIGVSAFFVGSAFARSRDKLTVMRPYLARLMEMTGETANLFVESEGEAVCIGQVESRHAMRAITGIGGRVLLHSSAAGKVLLAYGDAGRRRHLLPGPRLASVTDATVTNPEEFDAILREVAAVGYGVDDEEHASGLRCVSAPVFDEVGQPVMALSVSGPAARIPQDRLPVLGRMVAQVSQEATREYGGDWPLAAQ